MFYQPSRHGAAKLVKLTFVICFSERICDQCFVLSACGIRKKRRTNKELHNSYVWSTSNLYSIKLIEETNTTQALKGVRIKRGEF